MEPPSSNVSGCWSSKEHELFLEAMKLFGKNWQKVSVFVGTRTSKQTRAHAQKFFEKIEKNCQKRDIQIRNKKAPVKVVINTTKNLIVICTRNRRISQLSRMMR